MKIEKHNEQIDTRDINLDIIRCVAMFMVIMVHTMGNLAVFAEPYNKMWYVSEITNSVVFACNGLFFLLSGYLILDKNISDMKAFYLRKSIKIGISFFIISFVYYLRTLYFGGNLTIVLVLKNISDFIMQFLTGNISSHFWFMYYLIGAYTMSPFLGKMVRNLTDDELKKFTIVCFGLQTFITTISFTKWSFYHQAFLTFGIINWMFYFLLGYTIKRLVPTKKIKSYTLMIAFIAALIIVMLEKRFISVTNPYIDTQSPTMIITTIAIFLLLRDYVKISSDKLRRIINYLAKHSFTVYMMHIIVLGRLIPFFIGKMDSGWDIILYGGIGYLGVCAVTIAVSVVLDSFILNPIIRRVMKCKRYVLGRPN